MWINEGMASYHENLFTESVYGFDAYLADIKANHKTIIQTIHHTENGYRAVSGIPHEYTYGDHVYKKGADVAHTMRGYMGDSLFFIGLQSVMDNFQFKSINSSQMRDQITQATGYDISDFYTDWVFNPGFPHFSIDSVKVDYFLNEFTTTVYVRQKLTGAPNFYKKRSMEFSFFDSNWNESVKRVVLDGEFSEFTFASALPQVFVTLNLKNKISWP